MGTVNTRRDVGAGFLGVLEHAVTDATHSEHDIYFHSWVRSKCFSTQFMVFTNTWAGLGVRKVEGALRRGTGCKHDQTIG